MTNQEAYEELCRKAALYDKSLEAFDTLLQKATNEVFVQCKQFNERFSKDWNEGFNDGMFHTLTIIKGIIEADKDGE